MPNREPPSRRPAGRRLSATALAATLALAGAAWSGSAPARQTEAVWVDVADAYLELHTGPGRGYPVTRVFARGEHVQVVKRRTDWYLLRDDRGREGWAKRREMAATLLALAGPQPNEGFQTPEQRVPPDPDAPAERAASTPALASAVRNTFNDGSYPDRDNHRWEAGTGGGRRGPSKVLRATLSYVLDENLSFETTLSQVLDGPRDEDLLLFGFTHTFRPERRFAPFVTLGVGMSRLHPTDTARANIRQVGYASAGFRYLLQQRLAFRADYRAFSPFSGNGNPKETNEWNVGFVFLF